MRVRVSEREKAWWIDEYIYTKSKNVRNADIYIKNKNVGNADIYIKNKNVGNEDIYIRKYRRNTTSFAGKNKSNKRNETMIIILRTSPASGSKHTSSLRESETARGEMVLMWRREYPLVLRIERKEVSEKALQDAKLLGGAEPWKQGRMVAWVMGLSRDEDEREEAL